MREIGAQPVIRTPVRPNAGMAHVGRGHDKDAVIRARAQPYAAMYCRKARRSQIGSRQPRAKAEVASRSPKQPLSQGLVGASTRRSPG